MDVIADRVREEIPNWIHCSTRNESQLGQFVRWHLQITDQKVGGPGGLAERVGRHFTTIFSWMNVDRSTPEFVVALHEILVEDLGAEIAERVRIDEMIGWSRMTVYEDLEWREKALEIRQALLTGLDQEDPDVVDSRSSDRPREGPAAPPPEDPPVGD